MKTEKELKELFYNNAHTVVETSYADTDNFMDIDDFIKAVGELNLCNLPVVKHSGSEFIEIGTKIQMQKREWWQIYKSGWHKHHDFWGRKWWIRYNWNI